jgi:hypothetical protein
MCFFSFLKYTSIIFAAHLATSCRAPVCRGGPFENHCYIVSLVAFVQWRLVDLLEWKNQTVGVQIIRY